MSERSQVLFARWIALMEQRNAVRLRQLPLSVGEYDHSCDPKKQDKILQQSNKEGQKSGKSVGTLSAEGQSIGTSSGSSPFSEGLWLRDITLPGKKPNCNVGLNDAVCESKNLVRSLTCSKEGVKRSKYEVEKPETVIQPCLDKAMGDSSKQGIGQETSGKVSRRRKCGV